MANNKQKVFVGMSGGVDSSVSALLLKEAGYDVTGVFIKVWQADFLPCTWREERRDAMRAAAHLSIPFLTLNLEEAYKREVVDYMIREYGAGRVPNPDVMCNKYVKFGAFLSYARAHGADYIATGHYARREQARDGEKSDTGKLLIGVDGEKDQSYFLWTLKSEELADVLFPIGHLQKSEVRAIAKAAELPNADKKDSQGLCFMGPVDMEDFLKHYIKTEKGDVVDEHGAVIGEHEGAVLYTIGQRHGFKTTKTGTEDLPYYVIAKDVKKNTVTVAHRDPKASVGKRTSFALTDLYLRTAPTEDGQLSVRIRYRGERYPAKLHQEGLRGEVEIASPIEGIAVGQSAVFYQGDECIGGGVIDD